MKTTVDEGRESALGHIKEKRGFKINLVIFLSVNTLLLVLWGALPAGGRTRPVLAGPLVGTSLQLLHGGVYANRT